MSVYVRSRRRLRLPEPKVHAPKDARRVPRMTAERDGQVPYGSTTGHKTGVRALSRRAFMAASVASIVKPQARGCCAFWAATEFPYPNQLEASLQLMEASCADCQNKYEFRAALNRATGLSRQAMLDEVQS